MAESMVTRTIIATKALIMGVNLSTSAVEDITISLPRTYKDEKSVLKAAEKIGKEGYKFVMVKSFEKTETLYGMPESVFIENASILDDTKRKEYKANKEAKKAETPNN